MAERITISFNGFLPGSAGGAQVDVRFAYDPGLAPVSAAGNAATYAVADPTAVVEIDGVAQPAPEIRLTVTDNLRFGAPGGPTLTVDTLRVEVAGGEGYALTVEPAAFVGAGQNAFSGTALPEGPFEFEALGESTLASELRLDGEVLELALTDFALGPDAVQLTASEARLVALLFEIGLDRDGALNPAGINYWIDQVEDGRTFEQLANAFLVSDEFAAAFGAPETLSDRALVGQLFLNGLDRPGAESGIAHWTGRLSDPAFSRGDLLIAFARSVENRDSLALVETLVEVSPGEWDLAG